MWLQTLLAGFVWDGMSLDGMCWDGIQHTMAWHRMEWNGMEFNDEARSHRRNLCTYCCKIDINLF